MTIAATIRFLVLLAEAVGGQVVYLGPTVAAFMRAAEGNSQSEVYSDTGGLIIHPQSSRWQRESI